MLWKTVTTRLKPIVEKMDSYERIKWTEILTLLDNVRLCWRNEIMHPQDYVYAKIEAQHVFEAVKAFLNCLAKELS